MSKEKKLEELDYLAYLSVLYDFYGELLSNNKKIIYEEYYLNDLSLAEIAKEQGISRQGVHDALKRATEELKEYEEKLALISKFKIIKEKLEAIQNITTSLNDTMNFNLIDNINELANDVLKEL